MSSPANNQSDAPYQSHPEGTASFIATTITSRVAIETGGLVQPDEAPASPTSDAGSTIVDGVVAGAETATSATDDNENTPNAIIPSLDAPIVRQSHRTSIGKSTNVPGSPNSNADPGASVDTINRVDAGPENPTVAANKNEAAGSAHAGIPAINATIRRQVPDVGQVRSIQSPISPTTQADQLVAGTIENEATNNPLPPIGGAINVPTFGSINSFTFDFRSYVDMGAPTEIATNANIAAASIPNPGMRASFIEPLVESEDEDLPPAYEEIPVLGAGRPRMVDTPSPRQPRGANETRFVLRSPPNPRLRRWSPISPSRRRRPAAQSPIRDLIEPDSPAVTYSSRDFQESPPTSPGSAPPMPETPRMRHAELPRTDEEYSAALFEIAFQNGLSSMRETISSYPANHPIARDLRRISRHANLYEAWFYSHRDNLVELIARPHSQVRLVYDTLFSSMERLVEIDSFFSTYNPRRPEM
ncbi:hypothetical protein MJO28_014702 [Puccinia striiformis f. sp. tritici]|uniref:Uncharacterized protein n=1 Tax=Puccinia striiformis f. sp. tritici TaxID=168172 RepID=A0ACC0DUE2_9BASI|nr:hypothetical protein Pst134EB_031210 [Puccinia striiformis f. sp. tritici]KAI7939123.1 hypothetical protein MJO28_014702 [Puccinia striiformis f. sp. tritici]